MPRNRLPRVMKQYFPAGRRNHGRPLKKLLDAWDKNVSTSGPVPWKIDDDVDDDDDDDETDFFPRKKQYKLHVLASRTGPRRRISIHFLLAYFSFIDPRLYIPARVALPFK